MSRLRRSRRRRGLGGFFRRFRVRDADVSSIMQLPGGTKLYQPPGILVLVPFLPQRPDGFSAISLLSGFYDSSDDDVELLQNSDSRETRMGGPIGGHERYHFWGVHIRCPWFLQTPKRRTQHESSETPGSGRRPIPQLLHPKGPQAKGG